MSAPELIKLRAPNGKRIMGALKRNGEVCPIACRFARIHGESNFLYEFNRGDLRDIPDDDAEFQLVDEDGGIWTCGDVEWVSMPPVR